MCNPETLTTQAILYLCYNKIYLMNDIIISTTNTHIKNILKLQTSSRDRKRQNLFVIEGYREISRALASGIEIKTLYVCRELDRQSRSEELLVMDSQIHLLDVGKAAFSRIAYREGSDGLIALAVPRNLKLSELKLSKDPLILVLESVEKPGNLGAIMRTADAAGIDAVIVCDPLTDIYNPNVIRSGVGCIFTRQVVTCSSKEAIDWLKQKKIKVYAAALTEKASIYHQMDFSGSTAIVMGTEATGLSNEWLDNSDFQVIIPMKGIADSMNVSTSAAVLVFEAVRQREQGRS
jgi:TrmH family RNA methyltransferase